MPKLTTTLVVTENKKPDLVHFAFLRHTLANPSEQRDAIIEHDSGVQILSLGTWSPKSTSCESLSIKAESFLSCRTMLTSAIQLTAASLSVASTTPSSSTKNFVLTTAGVGTDHKMGVESSLLDTLGHPQRDSAASLPLLPLPGMATR